MASKKTNQLPIDGYVRVSRVGGRDKHDGFISPQVQEEAIQAWAVEQDVELRLNPPELNRSGGTMDRPIFNEIMAQIRAGQSGGIVVYKLDRFARSVRGALNTLAELGGHEAGFASCCEGVSYVKAADRALLQLQFVFAELTRGQLKESWAQATERAVARGVHISNSSYLGYDRQEDGRLVANEQAGLVGELFRRRADGAGWHSLASFLDREAPLPDGQRWIVPRVQRLLANRVYRGEAFYGQHRNREAHEQLISEAAYQRAQEARGVSLPRKPDKEPILLAGLARCASCRYTLKEGSGGKRGKRIRTYRCNRRAVAGPCPAGQCVVGENLERFVVEAFKTELRAVTGEALESSAELEAARKRLDEAQAELKAFTGDLAIAERLRRAGQYEPALEVRLRAVEQAQTALTEARPELAESLPCAEWEFDIEQWWETAGSEARIKALNAAIDAVFVRGPGRAPLAQRVLILWRGQGPDDLPRRGASNGPLRPYPWPREAEGQAGVERAELSSDDAQRRLEPAAGDR